jgi:CheY-like chemotaxis protein
MDSHRLLVVDDDPDVLKTIGDILDGEGYHCDCVTTDEQAYKALTEQRSFDAVIVDMNLGLGTTGGDVARFARRLHPDLPVVFMSGELAPRSPGNFGVPGSVFVAKPFTVEQLRSIIEDLDRWEEGEPSEA